MGTNIKGELHSFFPDYISAIQKFSNDPSQFWIFYMEKVNEKFSSGEKLKNDFLFGNGRRGKIGLKRDLENCQAIRLALAS